MAGQIPGADGVTDIRALIVGDEREITDAYTLRLRSYCEIETAYGSKETLSVIRDSPVDIILLDRRMPGSSSDGVLTELDECDLSGRVVMMTAAGLGVEVLDIPFDDYLCKLVDREGMCTVIDRQQQIPTRETLGEFFRIEAKHAVLKTELSLERRHEYRKHDEAAARARRLKRQIRRLLPDNSILD